MENKIQALEISMAEFKKEIGFIKLVQLENKEQNSKEHQEIMTKIDNFIDGCDKKYVTKEAFSNVQKIVYGMAGAILLAVVYAIMEGLLKR